LLAVARITAAPHAMRPQSTAWRTYEADLAQDPAAIEARRSDAESSRKQ
jgi:hypothetical protein